MLPGDGWCCPLQAPVRWRTMPAETPPCRLVRYIDTDASHTLYDRPQALWAVCILLYCGSAIFGSWQAHG
jgi:hypothetical protein